jgi:signal peptidase I
MKRRAATRAVTVAVNLALLTAGWLVLAPPELGGSTRYAIVQGSSMAPLLSDGDLAAVRSSDEVGVGDVVLYREPDLGVGVLHRVIRREGDRLVLKGDANGFLDDLRPKASEVQGELWFSVPYAGSTLAWIRVPSHASLLVFVLTLLSLAPKAPAGGRPEEVQRG